MSADEEVNPLIAEWTAKLKGKVYAAPGQIVPKGIPSFVDADLTGPGVDEFRVLTPSTPRTRDFRLERLNVFVDENNTCTEVGFF